MENHLFATDVFDQSQVKAMLEPHFPVLHQIVMEPWRDWLVYRESDANFRKLDHTGAAHWLHPQMVDMATVLAESQPELRTATVNKMFVLDVGDNLRLSIKKLHKDKRGRMVWSNVRTSANRNYYQQSLLLDMPQQLKLILGYELDFLMTKISVFIACPKGKRVAWAFRLPEQGEQFAAGGNIVIPSGDDFSHNKKGFNVTPKKDASEGRG